MIVLNFYAVNEDEFNNIMIRIKSYIDENEKLYSKCRR